MFRKIIFKSPIATKEIFIDKQKDDLYCVDIIAYGNWDATNFKTLKECFNYIRTYFNLQKGNNNGQQM